MRLSLRETLQKLLIAGLLLGIPLYQKFPLFEVPGTFVRIRIEDFLIFFIAIYVALHYFPKIRETFQKPIEKSVFLFWMIGLLSVVSAILVTKTVVPHIAFLHWARRIEYMVVFFFALSLTKVRSKEVIDFVMKLLLIATFLVSMYGMGQKFFNWPVIITQNEQYSKGIALRFVPGAHMTSTFAGHYDLATYLVLVLPIFIVSYFVVKNKSSKIIFTVVAIIGLYVLANTLSRISIVSYFVAVCTALLFVRKYKEIVLVLLISVLVFSFSSNLFDRYLRIIEVTKERLNQIIFVLPKEVSAQEELPRRVSSQMPTPTPMPVFEDRSTSIRFNVEWPRALRAFRKNPLLGTGYSSITLATDNDYLRAIGEVGILGLLSFVLIVGLLLRDILKLYPRLADYGDVERGFLAGVAGGLFGVLTNAFFIDVFESSKFAITFWLIIGIFVYLARTSARNKYV